MFEATESPYLIPFDSKWELEKAPTQPPQEAPGKSVCKDMLRERIEEMDRIQRVLVADRRYSVLIIFQAMDAAGKDSTIRTVFSGVNPAHCNVHEFAKPTEEEYDHDFLWRTSRKLPARGKIGIFNRSYYEEVLVARVHPSLLDKQRLPFTYSFPNLWEDRYESIIDHERHLARNGTIILKFWLNISPEEQRRRLLSRIDKPHKNWKFEAADIRDRKHWEDYMRAYEEMLHATSKPWAPWYAIPADSKPWMRLSVAEIVLKTLGGLDIHFPSLDEDDREQLLTMREVLEGEGLDIDEVELD